MGTNVDPGEEGGEGRAALGGWVLGTLHPTLLSVGFRLASLCVRWVSSCALLVAVCLCFICNIYIYVGNGVAFFGFLSNLLEYGFSVLLPDVNRRRQTSLCVTSVAGNFCIYHYIPLLGPS